MGDHLVQYFGTNFKLYHDFCLVVKYPSHHT